MKRSRNQFGSWYTLALAAAAVTLAVAGCAGGRAATNRKSWEDTRIGLPNDAEAAPRRRDDLSASETRETRPRLTLEDLFLLPRFSEASPLQTRWAGNGSSLTFLWPSESSEGAVDLVEVDLNAGTRSVLIGGDRLLATDIGRRPAIEDYAITEDGDAALLFTDAERVWREKTKGYYYHYDFRTQTLRPVGDRIKGPQMFAKLSPDARHVGFVRDRNLYLSELATGEETRITSDDPSRGVINGTYDWVYEEEFRLRDGWRWSPDGAHLAFVQLDESLVPEFVMTDLRTPYPRTIPYRYPKAGARNSEIRIGIYDCKAQSVTFFETGTWNAGEEPYEYLVGIGWTPPIDGVHHVWTLRMNRGQNRVELLYLNPANGAVRVILEESEPAWIEAEEAADWIGVAAGKIRFLDDAAHFVWISEVSGFRHLYLYRLDGTRLCAITQGEWDVTGFHGVFDGHVFYSSSQNGSLERHAWRIPLTGGKPTRITDGPGWNHISPSPDGRHYLHTFSAAEAPTSTSVRSKTGETVWTLEDNRLLVDLVAEYELPPVEFLRFPGADGTLLDAYLIKPSHFDSTRSYPLLIHVYGGPGSKEVSRRWTGAERLWHHFLAEELGVLVAGVDGRGTGYRGKAFRSAVYRQLGLVEAADQIAAARYLASKPWVDETRMGIWGWSYGGTMTLMSMLTGEGPNTFRMGMSVAPVVDWRLYDSIYSERYMSTPEDNPDGYALSAATGYADRLSENQALLLVHGDLDDNVHFQNTVQMVDALHSAGKDFSVMFYPGTDHGISGGNRRFLVYRTLTRFVAQHLAPAAPGRSSTAP